MTWRSELIVIAVFAIFAGVLTLTIDRGPSADDYRRAKMNKDTLLILGLVASKCPATPLRHVWPIAQDLVQRANGKWLDDNTVSWLFAQIEPVECPK